MKKLKLGIFGASRGTDNLESILANDVEIVAVCDKNPKWWELAKRVLGDDVPCFTDFDEFIEQEMDAVYLCNYFPEHAPYAVRALEKNISVLSELLASSTMADSVALVRAAEKSKGIYMLAENYPYMVFNQEMQRVYRSGKLGRALFCEGEYNHPIGPDDLGFIKYYYDSEKHWRNYVPATYYVTHSLGPLMMATHANPIRVTAMPIFVPESEKYASTSRLGDNSAIITCLNDDNSVFRVTGWGRFGGQENSYRLACTKGQIENVRFSEDKVMLSYNAWDVPEGEEQTQFYAAQFSPEDAALSRGAGHGGSDCFMMREFFRCIRAGEKPYLDEYVATTMSSVAILGHRSLLQNGVPFDIPDFHKEEERVKWENDRLTPFWGPDGSAPTLPVSSRPYVPTEEMQQRFRDVLKDQD